MLFDTPLRNIIADDILNLERDGVFEDKHLDYKECDYTDTPYGRDDFRKDVTAFANASGGDIILGIKEIPCEGGMKGAVIGLNDYNEQRIKDRLYALLKNCIQKRIPGVDMKGIDIPGRKPVWIIRVPRSFNQPHQVTIQDKNIPENFQFWVRHGAGNVRMDVDELRNAFLMSETLTERIRSFRMERLGNILSEDTFLPMEPGAKVVLHLVPQNALGLGVRYDVRKAVEPLNRRTSWGSNPRYNFDGFITWFNRPATRYIQVFRNGILEAVSTDFFGENSNGNFIAGENLVRELIEALPELFAVQQELGVEPPIAIMLSLVGVKEYGLAYKGGLSQSLSLDVVPLPEEICETFDVEAKKALKPVFDMLWNTAGYNQCDW